MVSSKGIRAPVCGVLAIEDSTLCTTTPTGMALSEVMHRNWVVTESYSKNLSAPTTTDVFSVCPLITVGAKSVAPICACPVAAPFEVALTNPLIPHRFSAFPLVPVKSTSSPSTLAGAPCTSPAPVGLTHCPSPRQKVAALALVPAFNLLTGKLPLTSRSEEHTSELQ